MAGRVGKREEPLLGYRNFAQFQSKFLKFDLLFCSAMIEREWHLDLAICILCFFMWQAWRQIWSV